MKPKRKILSRRWLIVILITLSYFAGFAQVPTRTNDRVSQKLKPILSADSKKGWHRFADGITLDAAKPNQFFEKYQDAFELREGFGMELTKHTEEKSLGINHYRFQQTYNGIPVAGAEYILHQRNGKYLKGNGTIVAGFAKKEKASISAEAALQAVLKKVGAKRYAWEDPGYQAIIKHQGTDVTLYPTPKLVYYSTLGNEDATTYQLAYEMNVLAAEPMLHQKYYVSAVTGEVINAIPLVHDTNTPASGASSYNGVQNFTSDFDGTNYVLKEANRGGSGTSIYTYDMNNGTDFSTAVNFQNNSATWQNEPVGVQGHWGFEMAFDYYLSVHGRNSYDNAGGTIISYLEFGVNHNNASWSQVLHVMNFGGGDGVTRTSWASLDVVAHELTHGVTEFSAGLIYQNESGALNESFSDIFGTAVEFHVQGSSADWLLSEDVTINGAGIRSMSSPNIHGDPDTYHGNFWVFTADDNGGVHSNSGVQNHWFYLLTNGGSGTNDIGNNFAVTGIGMDMAAAIAYRNLTQYLTPSSRYADAREGALQAAEDLYGRTSQAYAQTAAAWHAVGVGFPIHTTEDLALQSVEITGGSCNQVVLQLANLSVSSTIPAGAILDVVISENGVPHPAEQLVLPSALAPGNSTTVLLNQLITSTTSKVDLEAQVNYLPDPEPGNNLATANVFRGTMTIGGVNPDYPTIDAAVVAINNPNNKICGHLVFKIRTGQYTGEVRISNVSVSSPEHTITFESESGNPDDVILYSVIPFNSAFGTVTIENSNYIRIRNVTISRELSGLAVVSTALSLRGQLLDVVLEGNKFKNPGIGTFKNNVELWPFGLMQKDITIRDNTFELANKGITTQSGNSELVENVVIENNRFINFSFSIHFYDARSLTIRANSVVSASANAGFHVSALNLIVERNDIRISGTNPTAIYIAEIPSSTVSIINNMVSVKSTSGSTAIYVSGITRAEVFHNTIRQEKTTPGNGSAIGLSFSANLTQKIVLNNILFNSVPVGAVGISLPSGGVNEINYNDFYIPNGAIGRLNTVTYQALTQWRTASGFDLNSIVLQPTFTSDVDLHLSSQQPGLRNGKLVAVPYDFDSEQRGTTRYIGADEFYFSSDVGVSAIGPIVMCETAYVQITVKNFSAVDVFSPGIRIPVSLTVNNGTPLLDTLILQQDLLPGQTATFVFTQVHNLTENTPVIGRTHYPGDEVITNDALTTLAMLTNTYTVGGINPDFTTIQAAINFVSTSVVPVLCDYVILRMRPGTYSQAISINEIPGVHLVFESETGNKNDVVITSSTTSTVSLPAAKHVTFRNLTLRYTGSSITEAVVLTKNICADIAIVNCNLQMPVLATEHYAIKSGPTLAPQVNGLRLTHNEFLNGGIKMESNANVNYPFDNIQIDSNAFVNSYNHAIFLNRTGLVTVSDNIITSTNVSSGISITQPLKDVRVERNRINLDAGVNGIYFYNLIPSFAKIFVYNNIINVKSGSNIVNGITIDGKGGYIYHNTVRLSTGSLTPTGLTAAIGTRNSGIAVRHNIFYNSIANGVAINFLSTNFNQDYNDIFAPYGNAVKWDTQYFATLAAWQTTSGLDLQSTNIEPIFVSANDLHLATYQPGLRGAGALSPFVPTDIDGDPRTFPLYMGADEFIRPPFIELSENAIDVPLFGQRYYINVESNADWTFANPLPNGITLENVTSRDFELVVNANPLAMPRDLVLTLQTTNAPVGTATLILHQEGPPTLAAIGGDGEIAVNWTTGIGGVTNYKVYFSVGTPPATTLLATVPGSETTFTHVGLVNGTTYVYQLAAVDENGNESAKSPAVTAVPSLPFITLSPSDVLDVPVFGRSFSIDVTSNANWIVMQPLPDGITVDNVTSSRFRVTVSANPLNILREFLVTVVTSASPVATANLHILQEGPPTLTAEGFDRMVALTWTPTIGATQYKLYALVKNKPKLLATLPRAETTYLHMGLANGTVYSYQVSAVDARGNESALSTIATAIPQRDRLVSQSLAIYPNPVEDKLTLRGEPKTAGVYGAVIVDSYGVVLRKQQVHLEGGLPKSEVEVTNLSPGIYLLLLSDPSGKIVETIRFEKK